MKMDATFDAMSILCRQAQTPLGWQEWINLVRARRVAFNKLLGSITLKSLGQTNCLATRGRDGGAEHAINDDNPKVTSDAGWDLGVQGVFIPSPAQWISNEKGVMLVWGVPRRPKTSWLLATLNLVNDDNGNHRVMDVKIQSVGLEEMMAKTGRQPREIFQKLHEVTVFWTELYYEKYKEIKGVRIQMDTEKKTLDAIVG